MGYESRVYVVSEPDIDVRYDGEKPMAEILASVLKKDLTLYRMYGSI